MRVSALLAVLAIIGTVLLGPLDRVPTVEAAPSQVTGGGVDSLRDCIVERRRMSTVVLVDESQSLRGSSSRPGTDVDAARVDALKSVIGSLALLPGEDGAGVTVDVRVAGFGETYSPVADWTRLTRDSAGRLDNVAEVFRERDDAVDTDYVLAMEGALGELDLHAAATSEDGPTCRAVIILSDGEYSLGTSGARKPYAPDVPLRELADRRAAVRSGLAELCRPGGLADRSRATGTVVIGLGLKLASRPSPNAELEGIAPVDFFTGLATGSSGGFDCGDPRSARHGAIATADDFGRLAVEVFCVLLGGCVEGGDPKLVEVDRSVSKLVIAASSVQPGLAISLEGPDGVESVVSVDDTGPTQVPGGTVAVSRQSDRLGTFVVAFDQSRSEQTGTWKVKGAGPGETSLGAAPQSNLRLEIEGEPIWTIGERGELVAQLVIADGIPVKPAELSGELRASLGVHSSSMQEQLAESASGPDADGRVELMLEEVPATSDSALTAVATVGGSIGEMARPEVEDRQSITLRRAGLPTLLVPDGGIRLSGVEGGDEGRPVATGAVQVLGDDDLDGTVCITGVRIIEYPDGASGFSPGDEDSCVDVAAGETVDLPVEVAVDDIRSGEYAGLVVVDLRSPSSDEAATVDAPLSFAGSAPVCTTVLLLLLAGSLAAVLLGALLTLFFVSRFTGRFPSGLHQRVQYARVENVTLTLDASGVAEIPQLTIGQFGPYISNDGAGDRGPYSVRNNGVLRARPRLLALPDARLSWPEGPVVGNRDGFLARRRMERSGALPLGLAGGWAFGVRNAAGSGTDDDPFVVAGELWAFLGSGSGHEYRLRALNADLRRRLIGASLKAAAARLASSEEHDPPPPPPPSPAKEPLPL